MFNLLWSGALAEEAAEAAEAAETVEAAASEAAPSWLQTAVGKVGEITPGTWAALAALVALAVILITVSRKKQQWTAKMVAYGALCIALSFVLSCIRLFRMPTGGSVTLGSMLPLMLFSVAYGVGPGVLAGLVYGVLQVAQGAWFLNVWQFIFDYFLAFAALGLAGIAKDRSDRWLYIGIPVAALGRAVSAIIAGMMWAADTVAGGGALEIGTTVYSSSLLYSTVYNGAYLIPDTLICLLLAALVGKRLIRVMKAGR